MFSVIIPLYNRSGSIERAVKSVLNQTFSEFELIIVDDGSEDDGAAKVEGIDDPRIRLFRQENKGVSAARNAGVAKARNKFLTFLDADDEYLPDFLATMAHLIEHYPQGDIFGCKYCRIKPDGEKIPLVYKGLPDDFEGVVDDYFALASRSVAPFCTISVCIRASSLLAIGGFPCHIRGGEDLLTWAALCIRGKVVLSSKTLAIYYLPEENVRALRTSEKSDPVGDGLKKLLPQCPAGQKKSLQKYIAKWYGIRARTYLDRGLHKFAFRFILKQIRQNPTGLSGYCLFWLNCLPRSLSSYLIRKVVK